MSRGQYATLKKAAHYNSRAATGFNSPARQCWVGMQNDPESLQGRHLLRTGLINPYPARQAASIVPLAAFNVAWVSRAILPFAIKLRSLAFRVVVE